MADTIYKLTHTGKQIDTAIDTVNMALTGGSASGNPVIIENMLKNSIVSLKVNGLTTQAGSGTPSPTNIRPISGVGEYRSNGYYTDIVVTTNGVSKTYTIGPMNSPLFDGDKLTWSGGSTVEVVRENKYLVLNGTEKWAYTAFTPGSKFGLDGIAVGANGSNTVLCSQYIYSVGTMDNMVKVYKGGYVDILDYRFTSAAEFKNYLAAQYANNTPVTIVYQIATPTTETVPISEPITNAAGTVTLSAENTVDVTISGAASAADLTTETNERITADTDVRGLTATVEANASAISAEVTRATNAENALS